MVLGFGYTFSFTETNGTVKTVSDNHWITGGGGGYGDSGAQWQGNSGTSWVGGYGGGRTYG